MENEYHLYEDGFRMLYEDGDGMLLDSSGLGAWVEQPVSAGNWVEQSSASGGIWVEQ